MLHSCISYNIFIFICLPSFMSICTFSLGAACCLIAFFCLQIYCAFVQFQLLLCMRSLANDRLFDVVIELKTCNMFFYLPPQILLNNLVILYLLQLIYLGMKREAVFSFSLTYVVYVVFLFILHLQYFTYYVCIERA